MPSVGFELKQARERLGLSAEQIEERTKVHLHKIEALEQGNIGRLPDGIYLDGIIRAYAHEVGLDPEPLIQQARDERANVADDWEESFNLDAIFRERPSSESPTLPRVGLFSESLPSERSLSAAPPQDAAAVDDDVGLGSTQGGRYRSRAVEIEMAAARAGLTPFEPAPHRSRLALSLFVLLALAGWGAYLYEFYRLPARDEIPVASAPSLARPEVARGSEAAPTGNIPPAATDQRPPANAAAVARESSATAGTTVPPPAQSSPDVPTKPPNAIPPAVTSPAAATAAPTQPTLAVAPAGDVSGNWRLTTHGESSNDSGSTGSNRYDIQLQQAGNRIIGSGRRSTENGATSGAPAQTPISLAGTIAGNRLTLTFTESGAQRLTQGKFVLILEDSGTLRGRFSITAAQSSGTVEAHRVDQP